MKIKLFLLIFFMSFTKVNAKEVDDFFCFNKLKSQSLEESNNIKEIINSWINEKIHEAIEETNQLMKDKNYTTCSDRGTKQNILSQRIKSKLTNSSLISEIERYLSDNLNDQQLCSPRDKDTIYDKSLSWYNPYRYIKIIGDATNAVRFVGQSINVCGVVFGLDKLGHFFDEGLMSSTYKRSHKQKGLPSINSEEGSFGLMFTGVKSFADIMANESGGDFYSSIINSKEDTNINRKPIVYCENPSASTVGPKVNPKFKYNDSKKFDICNYVDWSWSEAVNCSTFSEKVEVVVTKNMLDKSYRCPLPELETKCKEIVNKYKLYYKTRLHEFIGPKCMEYYKSQNNNDTNSGSTGYQ